MRPQYLRVRNWEKFQHYKDRRPVWIKLYVDILQDYELGTLSDSQLGQLVKLWILAAGCDNAIPNDQAFVRRLTGSSSLRLDFFIERGLLEPTKQKTKRPKWPSRHISAALREEVLTRDSHQCRSCSQSVYLEIDHVVPVSLGGKSELGNLQVLCRSCNRKKRAKSAEHPATQKRDPRSLETETETEAEKEKEAELLSGTAPVFQIPTNLVKGMEEDAA